VQDDELNSFLVEFPLKSKWLDDIISVLLNRPPSGTAHVKDIGPDLYKDRYVASLDETITRRINDFCSDAADFKKSKKYDLFERVEPATYRLRTYPNFPETLELVRIEFDDSQMNDMWKLFTEIVEKKDAVKWRNLDNHKKLLAFARYFRKSPDWQTEYDRRKAALQSAVDSAAV
jgi:hypothetical protein